jgi:hypothetical protein
MFHLKGGGSGKFFQGISQSGGKHLLSNRDDPSEHFNTLNMQFPPASETITSQVMPRLSSERSSTIAGRWGTIGALSRSEGDTDDPTAQPDTKMI